MRISPTQQPVLDARVIRARALAGVALWSVFVLANAQSRSWDIPRASVRAVLQQWSQELGYGIVWSEGIPDFPTREARLDGDFATAVGQLVNGSAFEARNLYCPPSVRFPATAYTLGARIDPVARLVFVYGMPTNQECRPM